jgi:hypothetical protein
MSINTVTRRLEFAVESVGGVKTPLLHNGKEVVLESTDEWDLSDSPDISNDGTQYVRILINVYLYPIEDLFSTCFNKIGSVCILGVKTQFAGRFFLSKQLYC